MSDALYRLIRALGAPWRYAVASETPLLPDGPAIYVCHYLTHGEAIRAILSPPVRLHPWVVADLGDPARAPAYLYDAFAHRSWRLPGGWGRAASAVAGRIAVSLIRALRCVPVEGEQGLLGPVVQRSLDLLFADRSLLIFPEHRERPLDPITHMRPWGCGFTWVAYQYEVQSGRPLPLYPVAICPGRRRIHVGPPRYLAEDVVDRAAPRPDAAGRRRALRACCHALEADVRRMYLGIAKVGFQRDSPTETGPGPDSRLFAESTGEEEGADGPGSTIPATANGTGTASMADEGDGA